MSTIIDVSSKLGEYMLKGWILTDNICKNCSKVPLMRSPTSPVSSFCANCDATPTTAASSSRPNLVERTDTEGSQAYEQSSLSSSASSSRHSRSSTPPTEVSSTLSSPTFAPPLDTEEILRRRQQSDTASAEIGRRMLKGWAMLADECPNNGCYGIPLVRPPKAGGEKDPRKECVICGTVYVDERGQFGESRLVPLNTATSHDNTTDYPTSMPHSATPSSTKVPKVDKGKAIDRADFERSPSNMTIQAQPSYFTHPAVTPTSAALEETAQSLELALHALTDRLKLLASSPVLDPTLIAQTADAINKVSQALTQVRQSQRNDS